MSLGHALHRTTFDYREGVELDAYPVEAWVHNPNMVPVINVMKRYWKLAGDTLSVMSQAEKEARDASEKSSYIESRQGMLLDAAEAYLRSRYFGRTLDRLHVLYAQAIDGSLTNRKAHIAQVWTWLWSIEDYIETQKGVIAAKTTVEQIEAMAWDFVTEFDGDDPQVTIASARAITD